MAKTVRFFLLMGLFVFLASMTGCGGRTALDPPTGSDTRRSYTNKLQALTLANYQFQKKYDLLQEGLQEEYEKTKIEKMMIGQLFSAIDLAEFYTYGFINYKRSLEFYAEADELNTRIKKSGQTNDYTSNGFITYYRASGKYALPKKYDCDKISSRISSGRKRISRIFKHQIRERTDSFELPEIIPLQTDNYAFAIQVERDVLSPAYFNQFEKKITKETRDYFKRRYKLPKSDHDYYISFNILRGLTSVFNFSSLSKSQIQTIFAYLENTRKVRLEESNELQDTYLDFVEVMCLTELGKYKKATFTFENLNRKIDKINNDLNNYLDSLKTSKDKAATTATAKIIGFLFLDVLTGLASGGKFRTDLTVAGVKGYSGSAAFIQRQINFTGESTYSKNWNILLNADDQLQLFRAVGKSYHKTGNLEKSILFNKEAVNIITNLRSTITTEEGRVSFAGYRDEVYEYLIDGLFRSKNYGEAFYYAENSRARSLVDLLGSKADISFGDQETNAYAQKMRDIQVYRDRLRRDVCISDQQVAYISGLEEDLEKELPRSKRGIIITAKGNNKKEKTTTHQDVDHKASYKELMTLITVSNLDHREIQKILPDDSTLVEYFICDNRIYVWIIDKNNFIPVSLYVNQEFLKDDIKHFNQQIKSGSNADLAALAKISRGIYDKIFLPLEGRIRNSSVYLVSHNFLHFLPFDALFTGKEYLVEKYSFSYLPSSSIIQFLEPLDTFKKSLLVFGNPKVSKSLNLTDLPGAEREARSISALFAEKKIFIKDKATETNFRKESSSYNITHLASHGIFDVQDALNSKLFLTLDDYHDGQLTAKELYEIPEVSDLIILSACETARAEIGKGDELLGLLRGFFFAGASSLVASLCIVDDVGTLKLMERFYNHMINENMTPIIALQKAKLDMIESKEFNAPFYWAPFNLYGLGI